MRFVRKEDQNRTKFEVSDFGCELKSIHCDNPNAARQLLHLYDLDSDDVTVGTTVPVASFPMPASTPINITFGEGISFRTALTSAISTAANGTGDPAATSCVTFLLA